MTSNSVLGEILENIDTGILLLANGDGHRVLYTNKAYQDLWKGTKYFQRASTTYNYPHSNDVSDLIKQKKTGRKTIELNVGTQIKYYYIHIFPLVSGSNEPDMIAEVSWDITETYNRHARDSDYKSLFFSLFQVAKIPVALVDSNGCISQFNPLFFNTLPREQTIINGTFIWNLFGDSKREVKELFDEMMEGRSLSFNYDGYIFSGVEKILSKDGSLNTNRRDLSCSWVLVQKIAESSVSCDIPVSSPTDPELEKLKTIVHEWETFFKVLGRIAALPWNLILGGIATIAVTVGGFSLIPANHTDGSNGSDRPAKVDGIQKTD